MKSKVEGGGGNKIQILMVLRNLERIQSHIWDMQQTWQRGQSTMDSTLRSAASGAPSPSLLVTRDYPAPGSRARPITVPSHWLVTQAAGPGHWAKAGSRDAGGQPSGPGTRRVTRTRSPGRRARLPKLSGSGPGSGNLSLPPNWPSTWTQAGRFGHLETHTRSQSWHKPPILCHI